jgi:hypothetical protein
MSYLLIFIYSMLLDMGAVLYTRSVQSKRLLLGMLVTGMLATLSWGSIWLVMRENDGMLMVISVAGHVVGFAIGMLLPVRVESQTDGPTTGPRSRSSDPS